jgi:hypothetical protein
MGSRSRCWPTSFGLATAHHERAFAGKRAITVTRVNITQTGQPPLPPDRGVRRALWFAGCHAFLALGVALWPHFRRLPSPSHRRIFLFDGCKPSIED